MRRSQARPVDHRRLPPYSDWDVFREIQSAGTPTSLEQHRPLQKREASIYGPWASPRPVGTHS